MTGLPDLPDPILDPRVARLHYDDKIDVDDAVVMVALSTSPPPWDAYFVRDDRFYGIRYEDLGAYSSIAQGFHVDLYEHFGELEEHQWVDYFGSNNMSGSARLTSAELAALLADPDGNLYDFMRSQELEIEPGPDGPGIRRAVNLTTSMDENGVVSYTCTESR